MNQDATSKKIKTYFKNSKLYHFMKDFTDKASIYPASEFDLKPKQQNQVELLSAKMWSSHIGFTLGKGQASDTFTFAGLFHEYKNNLVLQGTEKSIPYFISDAAKFSLLLEKFEKEKQQAKQNQNLQKYYKDLFPHKAKDVLSLLLDDLTYLSDKYGLNFNKKAAIEEYNSVLSQYK